jgi:chemotaxis protein MotB
MARMAHLAALAALGSFLSFGCVSAEKYGALKLERDGLYEQLSKAQSDASSANARADSFKTQLDQMMNGATGRDAIFANLQKQVAELQAQNDELNKRYGDAMNKFATGPALPAELDNALKAFAAQNPDLVEFDSNRGIVKFKSDVTFATGDATVTSHAKEVLQRFSQILNSEAASKYDLMVAGHTDNVRVSNRATISKGHLDNWYLSAHRAISVNEELQNDHVSAQRIAIVGYADQRPIASNSSDAGRQQNRRVEVLILPTHSTGTVAAAPTAAPAAPTRVRAPAMNKDTSAGVNTGPIINK